MEAHHHSHRRALGDELRTSVKLLLSLAVEGNNTIDDNSPQLDRLCLVMEKAFNHGLQASVWGKWHFWDFIQQITKLHRSAGNSIQNVLGLSQVRTSDGRGRAWIRFALIEKKLDEYMHILLSDTSLTSKWYAPYALFRVREHYEVFLGFLAPLSVVDFSLCLKDIDFDNLPTDMRLYSAQTLARSRPLNKEVDEVEPLRIKSTVKKRANTSGPVRNRRRQQQELTMVSELKAQKGAADEAKADQSHEVNSLAPPSSSFPSSSPAKSEEAKPLREELEAVFKQLAQTKAQLEEALTANEVKEAALQALDQENQRGAAELARLADERDAALQRASQAETNADSLHAMLEQGQKGEQQDHEGTSRQDNGGGEAEGKERKERIALLEKMLKVKEVLVDKKTRELDLMAQQRNEIQAQLSLVCAAKEELQTTSTQLQEELVSLRRTQEQKSLEADEKIRTLQHERDKLECQLQAQIQLGEEEAAKQRSLLNEAQEALRNKTSEADTQKNGVDALRSLLDQALARENAAKTELASTRQAMEEAWEGWEQAKQDCEELEEERKQREKDTDSLRKLILAKEARIEELHREAEAARVRYQTAESAASAAEENRAAIEARHARDSEIWAARENQQLELIASQQRAQNELRAHNEALQRTFDEQAEARAELSRLEELRRAWDDLQKRTLSAQEERNKALQITEEQAVQLDELRKTLVRKEEIIRESKQLINDRERRLREFISKDNVELNTSSGREEAWVLLDDQNQQRLLDDMRRVLEVTKQMVEEKAHEIDRMQEQLRDREARIHKMLATIEELQRDNTAKQSRVVELNDECGHKDEEKQQLLKQCESLKQRSSDLEAEVARLTTTGVTLQEQVAVLKRLLALKGPDSSSRSAPSSPLAHPK